MTPAEIDVLLRLLADAVLYLLEETRSPNTCMLATDAEEHLQNIKDYLAGARP